MNFTDLPALGQPLEGGIFAGLTTTKEGRHCAVILLADEPDTPALPWKKAMQWAEGLEASLPTRPVAAMLFANLKDQFKSAPSWHWTCESWGGSYAWNQYFILGAQSGNVKSYEGRARAVRLIQLTA